jgi:hypothetical protein
MRDRRRRKQRLGRRRANRHAEQRDNGCVQGLRAGRYHQAVLTLATDAGSAPSDIDVPALIVVLTAL